MPWKMTTPITEHLSVIEFFQTRLWSMTELCMRFDISGKTGYKWLRCYAQEGLAGLQEKSRVPLACPHRIAQEVAAALVEAKHVHPSWGPRKILSYLARHRPLPNCRPRAAPAAASGSPYPPCRFAQ